jgi:hypothetical protein
MSTQEPSQQYALSASEKSESFGEGIRLVGEKIATKPPRAGPKAQAPPLANGAQATGRHA